ncbi:MAG: L,D-transpeptidase [Methylobacteriaceae bacterium]|nr:L,D-transpeptidase [Methylobacteriaceae bacterium]
MRRLFPALAVAALALGALPTAASAYEIDILTRRPLAPGGVAADGRPKAAAIQRETVAYGGAHAPGTIVISTAERRLYYVLPNKQAVRYGVGVGRPGFEWGGTKTISQKREWPDWTPPPQMLKRRPDLPRHMKGGIENPLGARAMYLGSSLYRIHGSNEPETIGQAVSSGCIRMTNDDVTDLYDRVKVGTRVVVIR